MVQLVLSFVKLNVHDEAFLELRSIMSNNLDQYLEKNDKYNIEAITNDNAYQLQYEQIALFFAMIMTIFVNYVYDVHLVNEEDHQQFVCN
jgi:hypothetical protein